jgi:hypothetical protein
VKLFQERIRSIHFWNIPGPAKNFGGADGSRWIMEGVRSGQVQSCGCLVLPPKDPVYVLEAMLVFDFAESEYHAI